MASPPGASCPGLSQPPLFHALSGKKNVLIAGCGGGYDIYSGIPLFWSLRSAGVNVHLANLSFTNLAGISGDWLTDSCLKVVASDERISKHVAGMAAGFNYFPEYYLSKFFLDTHGLDIPVYTVDRSVGAVPLARIYNLLAEKYSIDAVICVDGGTDSMMLGDEEKLGTPTEDNTSIAAVNSLPLSSKFLVCLGFGIDDFHGVSHHLFLENTSTLIQDGGFFGAFSITSQMPEGQQLVALYEYVAKASGDSIVCSSVCNALQGKFGNVQSSPRTAKSELYINPLMSLYWCYDLTAVARRMPHIKNLMATKSRTDVGATITAYRNTLKSTRPAKPLPL